MRERRPERLSYWSEQWGPPHRAIWAMASIMACNPELIDPIEATNFLLDLFDREAIEHRKQPGFAYPIFIGLYPLSDPRDPFDELMKAMIEEFTDYQRREFA
jgi:hypothetical protein